MVSPRSILASLIVAFLLCAEAAGQTVGSAASNADSSQIASDRRGIAGIEAAHGWRTDADHFQGFFFRGFYEAQIGRIYLNAGVFCYQKINDGFGFDFRIRAPSVFYPSGSHTNFSPLAGFSFTVWPVTRPTVSIGFPFGVEYELLIEHFPNLSVSANAAPQLNLSSERNTVVFDVRLGLRFD